MLDLYGYKDIETKIHITELILYLDDVQFEPIMEEIKSKNRLKKKVNLDGKAPTSDRCF